jgi:hypothetical protein
MIKKYLVIILSVCVLVLSACQKNEKPILNKNVVETISQIPVDFKEKIKLPTTLPFNPKMISSFYGDKPTKNYEQVYMENEQHSVHLVVRSNTSSFGHLKKIKLKNGIDAFYDTKGILYWNDDENNVNYLLSSVDHSKSLEYKLSKEELVNIASSMVSINE